MAGIILCFIMAFLDYYNYGNFTHSLDVLYAAGMQAVDMLKNLIPGIMH